jgi:cytidyltransferase-like protein
LNGERVRRATLGAIFSICLSEGTCTEEGLAERLGLDRKEVGARLDTLEKDGMVERKDGGVVLTAKGRGEITVVFIGGGFEVLHPGHIHTIEQAKRLGDVLVAVLARDSTIRKTKGREPFSDEEQRVKLVSSVRQVDAAILGVEGDIYRSLERVRPDLVALGYDQKHSEREIEREAKKRGIELEVVRLTSSMPEVKTSKILRGL